MAAKKSAKKTNDVTREDAVADVQASIAACRKTAPNPACMSSVDLDSYADDLVRVIGLVAAVRHDSNVTNLDVRSLDKALGDLNEIRVALGFAHQALVDAGVVDLEG